MRENTERLRTPTSLSSFPSNATRHFESTKRFYTNNSLEYFSSRPRTNFDLDLLMLEIGERVAVIDACLPPQLADDLRERGISAVWVPAIMGDGASDEEIDRQLLISDWQLSYFKNKKRVLLTKDVGFYKRIRSRAILIRRHHHIATSPRPGEA